MFDGLMVHGNHYEDAELLLGLEEFLKDKWKWEFKLTFKEHSNMIELPEDFELSNVRCYSEMKNEFEQNHLEGGWAVCEGDRGGGDCDEEARVGG